MDSLSDSLISADRKISRRLKWKLLFSDFKNRHLNSPDTRTAFVNNVEELVEPKDMLKNRDKSKNKVSLCTRCKVKSCRKIRWKKNVKQTHSKSSSSEILQKKDDFDVSVVIFNSMECVLHDLLQNDNNTLETKNTKNQSKKYILYAHKGGTNNLNHSCPVFQSKNSLETKIRPCISFKLLNKERIKSKSGTKSINEIVDNLKKKNLIDKHTDTSAVKQGNDRIELEDSNLKRNIFNLGEDEHYVDSSTKDNTEIHVENTCSSANANSNELNNSDNKLPVAKTRPLSVYNSRTMNNSSQSSLENPEYNENRLKCKQSNEHSHLLKNEHKNFDNVFKKQPIPISEYHKKNNRRGISISNDIKDSSSNNKYPKLENIDTRRNVGVSARIQESKTKFLMESLLQNALVAQQRNVGLSNSYDAEYKMCLSKNDKKYIYSYLKEVGNTINYQEMLRIVNFIEQHSPKLGKYILGMRILEVMGKTDGDKYNDLLEATKGEIFKLSRFVQRNLLEAYNQYTLWLYERKRKMC